MALLIANWKLNNFWDDCEQFAQRLEQECPEYFEERSEAVSPELVVCPAHPYVAHVGHLFEKSQVMLGAQDVSRFDSGAYTGEVSARMLSDCGCDYCIVGHSERRSVLGEGTAPISDKLLRLCAAEITAVLCVGEPLDERLAGRAEQYTQSQLDAVAMPLSRLEPGSLVVAYEPIWAIGTGRNAEPADAEEMAQMIRDWLSRRLGEFMAEETLILYGGSVKPENIGAYLEQESIGGALVGGASLKAESFAAMVGAYREVLADNVGEELLNPD
jgi:triosephosphate isomerase